MSEITGNEVGQIWLPPIGCVVKWANLVIARSCQSLFRKKARADGQLTEEEMRHAHRLARERAIQFGRTWGLDVLRELGEGYLDLWIAKLVKKLKRR